MKLHKISVAMVVLLAAAGCSSSAPTARNSTSQAQQRPTMTPSSDPTEAAATTWTLAQARTEYLAMVKPGNAVTGRLNAALAASPPVLATITSDCRAMASAEHDLAVSLTGGHWPAAVQSAIDDLVSTLGQDRLQFQNCGSATTLGEVATALHSEKDASSSAAETVRVKLGLPGTS